MLLNFCANRSIQILAWNGKQDVVVIHAWFIAFQNATTHALTCIGKRNHVSYYIQDDPSLSSRG
jgi:hypothetical protein